MLQEVLNWIFNDRNRSPRTLTPQENKRPIESIVRSLRPDLYEIGRNLIKQEGWYASVTQEVMTWPSMLENTSHPDKLKQLLGVLARRAEELGDLHPGYRLTQLSYKLERTAQEI